MKKLILLIFIISSSLIFSQKNDTATVYNILEQSKELSKTNKDSALVVYEQTLALSKKTNYTRGYFRSLNGIKLCSRNFSTKDSIAKIILNDKRINQFPALKFNVILTTGYDLFNSQQFDSAIVYLDKALAKKSVLADSCDELKRIFYAMGYSHFSTGKYKQAVKLHQQAINYAECDNDSNSMADNYMGLTNVFYYLKNYSTALENCRKAFEIYNKTKNLYGKANSFNLIGNIYHKEKKYDEALRNYNLSLKICEELNISRMTPLLYCNIGNIYFERKNYTEAKQFYEKSLQMLIENNNTNSIVAIYPNLSQIYLESNDYKKAIEYAKKGVEGSIKTNQPYRRMESLNVLAGAYEKSGNHKLAYQYLLKAKLLNDSLITEQNNSEISQLNKKFETEKKELQIQQLQNQEKLKEAQLAAKELENKKQSQQKWFAIFGFIIVLIVAIISYKSYTNKKKDHELIIEQKQIVENQKLIVEQKNKEVIDSISYAKRLQEAILIPTTELEKALPNSFLVFKPKDIVSGDFYWVEHIDSNTILFAVADCTGHGVPGALVSVVGHNALTRCVKEFKLKEPAKILDKLNELVKESFSKSKNEVRDGMDIALCKLNLTNNILEYAGANNPLIIIRNQELIETKPTKQPIGFSENPVPFENNTLSLQKDDSIYIFSDGYADQFGGEKGKKFKLTNLKKLLFNIQNKDIFQQKEEIEKTFTSWKGDLEQLDDVCIMGIKI